PPAIEPNNLVCPYSNLFARLDFSQYASTTPTPLYKHKLRNEPPRILPTSTFISNKGINKYSKKGPINAKQKITNTNRYFFNPNLSCIITSIGSNIILTMEIVVNKIPDCYAFKLVTLFNQIVKKGIIKVQIAK